MEERIVSRSVHRSTASDNSAFQYLSGTPTDQRADHGIDLTARWRHHWDWWNRRLAHGFDPYSKATYGAIAPYTEAVDRAGTVFQGINFASQEYLNLATHPEVKRAAHEAIEKFGVHSAGSAALMGNTAESQALEREIAAFLGMEDCNVFTTGWSAGYGTVKTLVRPHDYIVIDRLAHACLQEAAVDSRATVHSFSHGSTAAAEKKLKRIRALDAEAGILFVTETLFSMDSDVPDLTAIRDLCDRYQATLMVDVAHDLGAMGKDGLGFLGSQGVLDKVDIIMGSFSKTFASNGGFVASNHPQLKLAFRCHCGPSLFTNAMSPVAAATVRACLRIVQGHEGIERRGRLMRNSIRLREGLRAEGFEVLGQPSAIVPVTLGDNALSRLITKHCLRMGAIVNLVEFPVVARNACRWRLQVMADHTEDQIDQLVNIAVRAREAGRKELADIQSGTLTR